MPYKVLQDFEVPGFPLFEAGIEYDIIPCVDEMERRGLVISTEKMIEKKPIDMVKASEEKDVEKTSKNSKRVVK